MGTLNLGKLHGVTRTAAGAGIACSVTVYPAGSVNEDGSLIGSPTASTIYSDQDGDTTFSNPMTADAAGRFACYAPPGAYDLRFTGAAIVARGIQGVQIPAAVNADGNVALPTGTVATVAATTLTATDATVSNLLTLSRSNAAALQFTNGGKITGPPILPTMYTLSHTSSTLTLSANHYGATVLINYSGAVAVTLPANGAAAGSWIRCINVGSDACNPTYSAATADTLVAKGDQGADSVTFASGQRTGSSVVFISTGTAWVAINENGACTMTINT